jgi:hypothetical protein
MREKRAVSSRSSLTKQRAPPRQMPVSRCLGRRGAEHVVRIPVRQQQDGPTSGRTPLIHTRNAVHGTKERGVHVLLAHAAIPHCNDELALNDGARCSLCLLDWPKQLCTNASVQCRTACMGCLVQLQVLFERGRVQDSGNGKVHCAARCSPSSVSCNNALLDKQVRFQCTTKRAVDSHKLLRPREELGSISPNNPAVALFELREPVLVMPTVGHHHLGGRLFSQHCSHTTRPGGPSVLVECSTHHSAQALNTSRTTSSEGDRAMSRQ